MQYAIDAISHPAAVAFRLDVDIGCTRFDRLLNDQVREPHDRGLLQFPLGDDIGLLVLEHPDVFKSV